MLKRIPVKVISLFLALVMLVGILPMNIWADTTTGTETDTETTPEVDESTYGTVTNYADFMALLVKLEEYAETYAANPLINKDPKLLVLNFIRCGVERYQDDNWSALAGQEIVGFTSKVKELDAANGTDVMRLRNIVIDAFILPNGNYVDFGHMFGCMNISYLGDGSADLSGWAGDLCDLLLYTVENLQVPDGTMDQMADYIRVNGFGVNAPSAFGWDDFYGDMDAYYLITELKKGEKKLSELMSEYFTASLTDKDRVVYFMNHRFGVENSQEAVRKAIYDAYKNDVSIKILESKRGVSSYATLREAVCYAFADYVFVAADGGLIAGSNNDTTAANGYYTVFSDEHSVLALGIEQNIKYAQTVDGKQIVYYVATVDVTRDDVTIMVNYKDNLPPVLDSHIGLQTVEGQAKALVENNKGKYENFNAIVATNGAGYNIYNGTPSGLVVMGGEEYFPITAPGFFGILKNGDAVIGTKEEYETIYKGQLQEGIAAFGAILVKDGKINVTKAANYASSRASRTAIGITAAGKVVMMVLDGRQLPFSAGGAMEEIAQIMLEAGCVEAVNLDGGGSTTYLSKPAGSDELQLVSSPSDGYARRVSTSLVAVSTAAPSNAFDHAIISSEYEYITAGTTMQFTATGVSNTGNNAPIPEGAYWTVSDTNIGTIDANGLFTAVANGEVTVQYMIGDTVAGSVAVSVVVPDALKMETTTMNAIYGEVATLPIIATYRGNRVCVKPSDFMAKLEYSNAGTVDGLTFIPSEAAGYKTFLAGAVLLANTNLMTYLQVNLYHKDEAIFDFDKATQGNRSLAWLREVNNTHTLDDQIYSIVDPNAPVTIDYTFGLDMTTIDIPAHLEPLKEKLPGEGSVDASAWSLLLSLAERVCVQTTVTITVDMDPNLILDISDLKISNQFFELKRANLDANNRLTLVCGWIKQGKAVDANAANPICILSGIKATVKDNAPYFNGELAISSNGSVAYDIYLAASSLYSFVTDPVNDAQNVYGLYPFKHVDEEYPTGCRGSENDAGAHFSTTYLDFQDVFTITTTQINGWYEDYYFVNSVPVTGIQLVPDRHDATQKRFCEFDAAGKLVSEQGVTGLITFEGGLYYPALGVVRTGWWPIDGKHYYFDLDTGRAVDGKYTIRENKNSWQTENFEYEFKDHVLVKGVWVQDSQLGYSGYRYRWAGDWIVGEWFEVDGKHYFSNKNEYGYVRTGYQHYIPSREDTNVNKCYLFDERGALREDFIGPASVLVSGTEKTQFFKNGLLYTTKGIIQGTDGYYYFVNNDATIVVSANKWVGIADNGEDWSHGLVPAGKTYAFDAYGRMTNALVDAGNITTNIGSAVISTEVKGRALTVTTTEGVACKVGYLQADGSYVAIDAAKNPYESGYNFAIPENAQVMIVIAGDVNCDGVVNVADQAYLAIVLANMTNSMARSELSATQKLAADVNGNGVINAADLLLIARSLQSTTDPLYKALW